MNHYFITETPFPCPCSFWTFKYGKIKPPFPLSTAQHHVWLPINALHIIMVLNFSIQFIFLKVFLSLCHPLFQQYVKGISSSGMQSNHGFDGQLSACWNHKMTQTEIEAIKSAGFLVSVIHGRCVPCVETLM